MLLAPTVNIHRSPLAGRNFECYSEDPLLSGAIAAAFVRGVQSQGIVTTVKHFAGNDAEFERNSINSVIDPRALREIYLVPFEMAVRDGGALGVMTAYNRLNGPHCSEHVELLDDILRGEWGFEGFVLTDWISVGSTVGSSTRGRRPRDAGPGPLLRYAPRRRRARRRRRRIRGRHPGRAPAPRVRAHRCTRRSARACEHVGRPARAPRPRPRGGRGGDGAADERRRAPVRSFLDPLPRGDRPERANARR